MTNGYFIYYNCKISPVILDSLRTAYAFQYSGRKRLLLFRKYLATRKVCNQGFVPDVSITVLIISK